MEETRNGAMNKVALRYRGIFLDVNRKELDKVAYKPSVALVDMTRKLAECGYTLSEELLHALSVQPDCYLYDITNGIVDSLGEQLNWTPLVKGWKIPTNEKRIHHVITAFFNLPMFKHGMKGTTLPCGHLIPEGTFPIERYNGCPFCGKPFKASNFIYTGQGSKLKELTLFTNEDMEDAFRKILQSPTPLDATQLDSLKLLVRFMDIPKNVEVTLKENCMVLVEELIEQGRNAEVAAYLKTPHDILRFLWYQHTGKVVVIRPKTLLKTYKKWAGMFETESPYCWTTNVSDPKIQRENFKENLKLKYNRSECRCVANWLNNMPMEPVQMAENMHPYRGMWVRFIRALRLAEYAKKPGYEKLAELMDIFYKEKYTTWSARLNDAISLKDRKMTLKILSDRPGLFARCLFATMLRFGARPTLAAFRKAAADVPARLVLSLANAAESYFDTDAPRYASPITGGKILIEPNKMLYSYCKEVLDGMAKSVNNLFVDVMYDHFAKTQTGHDTMYIEPQLYEIPVSVGDRSAMVQDTSCALQGTRFQVEGDNVRLFMQWGVGLPTQHLDMDLSCVIIYDDKTDYCAYYRLATVGALHSGDIRYIPDEVGAAEYIELDVPALRESGAKYVVFMCNAYSNGKLSPNLQVGWMCSENPMEISDEAGVAYDPSCVQHMVRVTDNNLSKGMTFGILEIAKNEITWLEIPNQSQIGCFNNTETVIEYLNKLHRKCSIGQLLEAKANAQGMILVESPENADEAYTYQWALNPSNVSMLLA